MKKITLRLAYLLCALIVLNLGGFFFWYHSATKLVKHFKKEWEAQGVILDYSRLIPSGFMLWNAGVTIEDVKVVSGKAIPELFQFDIKAKKAQLLFAGWRKNIDLVIDDFNVNSLGPNHLSEIDNIRTVEQNNLLLRMKYDSFKDAIKLLKHARYYEKNSLQNIMKEANLKFDHFISAATSQEIYWVRGDQQELYVKQIAEEGNISTVKISVVNDSPYQGVKLVLDTGSTDANKIKVIFNKKYTPANKFEEMIHHYLAKLIGARIVVDMDLMLYEWQPFIDSLLANNLLGGKINVRQFNIANANANAGLNLYGQVILNKLPVQNKTSVDLQLDVMDIDALTKSTVQFFIDLAKATNGTGTAPPDAQKAIICAQKDVLRIIKKHAKYDELKKSHQISISLPQLPVSNFKVMGMDIETLLAELSDQSCM